jgi:hypothetical protein
VVRASNVDWNAVIAAGGAAAFGFTGAHATTNAKPTAFTLNGTACGIA